MNFLPIVTRELLVASRKPQTYRTRLISGGLMVVIGMGAVILSERTGFRAGVALLGSVTFMAMIAALAAGLQATADALSEEKREGTLGLLFLADLKGYDIVLGKLVSCGVATFCGLLSILPVASIAFTYGGVQAGQVVRVSLALLNALLFSLSLGLMVSSVSRDRQKAVTVSSLLALFFWMGLPALGQLGQLTRISPWVLQTMTLLSPSTTYNQAVYPAAFRSNLFWPSLLATHLLCWLCLWGASAILPRAWQDKPAGPSGVPWRDRLQRWRLGDSSFRRRRRERLDLNPFFWLTSRNRFKPFQVLIFYVAYLAVPLILIARYQPSLLTTGFFVFLALSLTFVLKLWFVGEACAPLSEERWQGTLEWLLSTPLSVNQIFRGGWITLRAQFGLPLAAHFVLLVGVIVYGTIEGGVFKNGTERALWLAFSSAMLLLTALDFAALGCYGMWSAMRAKQRRHATGAAFGRVVIHPAVLAYAGMIALAFVGWIDNHELWVLGGWIVLKFVNSALSLFLGWRGFHRDLRKLAMQRYAPEETLPFWKRLRARRPWSRLRTRVKGRTPPRVHDS